MLVDFQWTTWHYIPDGRMLHDNDDDDTGWRSKRETVWSEWMHALVQCWKETKESEKMRQCLLYLLGKHRCLVSCNKLTNFLRMKETFNTEYDFLMESILI
jgi:hypothetical protein